MIEKIRRYFENINWNSIKQIILYTLQQLGISFLPIIIAIFTLCLLGDKVVDIIKRTDILGSAIITSVCISLEISKENKEKTSFLSIISKAYIAVGIVCYTILTITDKIINVYQSAIRYNVITYIMYIGIFISMILVFLNSYDSQSVKIQKMANDNRNMKNENVGGKQINLGD